MANKSLTKFCEQMNSLELVDTYDNGKDALIAIEKQDINLIFLEIEKPRMTGFELLEVIGRLPSNYIHSWQ